MDQVRRAYEAARGQWTGPQCIHERECGSCGSWDASCDLCAGAEALCHGDLKPSRSCRFCVQSIVRARKAEAVAAAAMEAAEAGMVDVAVGRLERACGLEREAGGEADVWQPVLDAMIALRDRKP